MSYRYQIAYSKTQQVISVFPEGDAPSSGHQLIGDFSIDDANADFEVYEDDLAEAIEDALAYVGQTDLSGWLIKVKTYKEGEQVPDRQPTSGHGVDVPRAMEHSGEEVPIADVAARHKDDMVQTRPIDRQVDEDPEPEKPKAKAKKK